MSLFIALVTISIAISHAAMPSNCSGGNDIIKKLTGYTVGGSNPPLPEMHSGYIEVNKTANGSMFYWLIKAASNSSNTPLVIWLNGGPGASSLTGLFAENGAFRIISHNNTLKYNQYTWSQYYHMLYIDNPIGTGFSFCNPGQEIVSEKQMAINFGVFMSGFYSKQCHQNLMHNPLFLTGESFAGRYIPFIWNELFKLDIVVKGVAMGNGIYDPEVQFLSALPYAMSLGFIDYAQYISMNNTLKMCFNLTKQGVLNNNITQINDSANIALDVVNGIYSKNSTGGNVFQYDVRVNNGSAFDGISLDIANYLKQPGVVTDANTQGIPWKSGDGSSAPNAVAERLNYDIMVNDSAWIIPNMLNNRTYLLFYNGQFDGSVCNNYGNSQFLYNYNYKNEWNNLNRSAQFLDSLCIGYKKISNDGLLTYYIVGDSGHLVPYDQPKSILHIITEWIDTVV